MKVSIKFLGAAGTVTGSKYLVSAGNTKILVDAGMFQGERLWRERNWDAPPFDPGSISAVLLTHAHIDHTGILPRYVMQGVNCPVYATKATAELSEMLLMDSARLQEEEADYRGRRGKSRHTPTLPLYTEREVIPTLRLFKQVSFSKEITIAPQITARWERMGHILGAGSIQLSIAGKRIVFSGDVGRYSVPILKDPVPVPFGDLLLIESTYGDRLHAKEEPTYPLGRIIRETAERGGVLIIPSFAVGRTQSLLYYIRQLKSLNQIPDIPVIIDSPMARDATTVYHENPECYDEDALGIVRAGAHPFAFSKLYFTKSVDESKKLNQITDPMIVIAGSGMLSGGRILHHIKHRIGSPLNTILFVGHQPAGGRGAWILSGAPMLTVLGDQIPIRAHIEQISGLSAHGDRDELLRWCSECSGRPGRVAIVHGEPESARAFSQSLEKQFGWNVGIPEYHDTWEI